MRSSKCNPTEIERQRGLLTTSPGIRRKGTEGGREGKGVSVPSLRWNGTGNGANNICYYCIRVLECKLQVESSGRPIQKLGIGFALLLISPPPLSLLLVPFERPEVLGKVRVPRTQVACRRLTSGEKRERGKGPMAPAASIDYSDVGYSDRVSSSLLTLTQWCHSIQYVLYL